MQSRLQVVRAVTSVTERALPTSVFHSHLSDDGRGSTIHNPTRPDPTHKTPHSMQPTMRQSHLTHWNPAESSCQNDMDNCTVHTINVVGIFCYSSAKKICKFLTSHCPVTVKIHLLIPRFLPRIFSYRKSDPNQHNPRKWKNQTTNPNHGLAYNQCPSLKPWFHVKIKLF